MTIDRHTGNAANPSVVNNVPPGSLQLLTIWRPPLCVFEIVCEEDLD